jgi:hypothetical protein
MKLIFLFSSLIFLSTSRESCSRIKKVPGPGCYKGRLEVKAACMNYTISVLSGNMDPARIESSWTDETTGKTYKNAFALGSRCTFPSRINAGDEFYFMIDSTSAQNCAVCMIYYPTPAKHLSIKVLDAPCTQPVR